MKVVDFPVRRDRLSQSAESRSRRFKKTPRARNLVSCCPKVLDRRLTRSRVRKNHLLKMKVLLVVLAAAIICEISARSVGDKTEKGAFVLSTNFHPKRMTQDRTRRRRKKSPNWFALSKR